MMSMSMTPREGHTRPSCRLPGPARNYGFDDDYLIMTMMMGHASAVTDLVALEATDYRTALLPYLEYTPSSQVTGSRVNDRLWRLPPLTTLVLACANLAIVPISRPMHWPGIPFDQNDQFFRTSGILPKPARPLYSLLAAVRHPVWLL
jgi:hypothetical protein